MKNLIKSISFTLMFTLLFTGCMSAVPTDETTSFETSATKKEPATEQVTEETTLRDVGYLNVTENDLETFRRTFCGYHYKEYNAETAEEEDLVDLFTDGYVCRGLITVARSLTNFPQEAFSQYAVGDEVDPMGLFEGSYVWIREDMLDFISQNIFGITFAHEFDEQKETNSLYYYHDGYFYFSCMITGLDVEDILIHDCIRQDDGRYLIKTELTGGSLEMDGEIYHKAYGDFLAGIVERDGIRYWEISQIHAY